MRNFMGVLRSSGVETGGPPAFSQADRQAFANQLDRLLAARARKREASQDIPELPKQGCE